jgi:hypothetical protein
MRARLETTDLPIKLRPANPSDLPFIKQTWIQTMRLQEPFKHMPVSLFKREFVPMVHEMLDHGFTQVLCHKDIEDEIMCFLNYKRRKDMIIFNFAYTKKPYRKMQLATYVIERLLKDAGPDVTVFYTHHSVGAYWLRERTWVYNPFLLWKEI